MERFSTGEKPKFKVGDRVKVIRYGHLLWASKKYIKEECTPEIREDIMNSMIQESEGSIGYDASPELVGKVGIIVDVSTTTLNFPQYAIAGIPGKHAWYSEGQLKKQNILSRLIEGARL